jgi:N-acetylglucosaminyldiphosphoundecaprenol N-acetyl-beta-D-mannosaminyltransferase
MHAIPRLDVLGVGVSAINMAQAVAEISRWIEAGERRYVCVTGVHGVMESQLDSHLMEIHNRSGLTTPDGMPLVWLARRAGAKHVDRVYGPDLMAAICALATERGWSSYFYGGAPGVPERLAGRLQGMYPGMKVAGLFSPPFRSLTPAEDDQVINSINQARPQLVWVGLSTPKQERWMAAHVGLLEAPVLLGVGAAFDIVSGGVPQAPRWMQRSGLEWFFRLAHEPGRLWRRYLINNPKFVLKLIRQHPHWRLPSVTESMDLTERA